MPQPPDSRLQPGGFVTNALAQRVEAAETQLLIDIVASTRDRRPERGAWSVPLGGGAAAWGGPGSPINKIAGLGFASVDEAALTEVEQRIHGEGAPVVAEVCTHADPALVALLAARGYRYTGSENVLGIALPAEPGRSNPEITVEELRPTQRDSWFDALVEGFAVPDGHGVPGQEFPRETLHATMRDMAGVPDYRCYLAKHRSTGEVLGGGALRTGGGIAYLAGASTLATARGQGVQTTLVTHRLAVATDAGCDLAVTVTQPGSTSQKNMQRQGLGLLFARAHLVLEKG